MSWKQQTTEPLYPNLIWSRPETKRGAGKLLIIGGQAQEFIDVAAAYTAAEQAGAGTVRTFMPDSIRKVTSMLPHIEYAPSNTSGSFSREAQAELAEASQWADGVLLAGNLGKNSETTLMLESFITNYQGTLVISYEAFESIAIPFKTLLTITGATLVLTFDLLQKIGIELGLEKPLTSSIGDPEFAQILQDLTATHPVQLVIQKTSQIWTAANGEISSSPSTAAIGPLAAEIAVWLIQNSAKQSEALATAVWQHTKRGR